MKYYSLLFVASFSLNASMAYSQVDHIGNNQKIPAHPRILMTKSDQMAVRKTIGADKTWTKLHQAIITESDNMLLLPVLERIQIGRRLLDKSREAIRRLFFLSYSY